MSRTRQVLWASSLSGASVFIGMAAWLVITKLATGALSPADFAVFLLLQLWADALNLLVTLGLNVSLPRMIAAAPEEEKRPLAAAALTGVAVTVVALSAIVLVVSLGFANASETLLGAENARFAHYAWLVPPLFVVGAMRDTAMAALAGFHRFAHRAASIVIASLCAMAFAAAAIALGYADVPAFSGAIALGHAVNLVWLYAALPSGARWRWDLARYRTAVGESFALYQNNLLTFAYQRVDTLLAQRILGLNEVALLGAAKYLPTILSRVMGALHVPLLPNLAGLLATGDTDTAARVMNRALLLTTVLCHGAALAATALAAQLLQLIAQPAYAAAAPVVFWLMTAMSLAIQTGIFGQTLIALGKSATVTRVNLLLATVSLGLNILLLPRYGFVAAGYAAFGAATLGLALQAYAVHRTNLNISLSPWLTAHALFAATATIWHLMASGPMSIVASFVYAPACVLLQVLPLGDLRQLVKTMGRSNR